MNYHGLKPVVSGSSKGDSASASLRAAFIPSLKRLGFSGKGDKTCVFAVAPGVRKAKQSTRKFSIINYKTILGG